MGALLQDVRYGVRSLLKAPGFTTVAVLSLALGIGANTAIFTLLDAALLRALPVERPAEIVRVASQGTEGDRRFEFSHPLYNALRDAGILVGLAAYAERGLGLSAGERTERIGGEYVSANYFSVLGVTPWMGSGLGPDDEAPGANPVVVIGHGLWRRFFGQDPHVVGKSILLDGRPHVVVGVAPSGFRGLVRGFPSDVWISLSEYESRSRRPDTTPLLSDRHTSWLSLVGRLGGESTLDASAARLTSALQAFETEPSGYRVVLVPAASGDDSLVGDLGRPLRLLFGAVGLVLAIACANVANLLLIRGHARQKEIGIRTALGAGRGRLLAQLLCESLLLSLAGGALGILLAWWTADLSSTIRTASGALRIDPGVSWRVLGFALALSVLAALVAGLVPALRAQRVDLAPVLKGAPAATRRSRLRFGMRDLLVVSQITLCVVLLVAAGLLLRSLGKLRSIDTGFSGRDVLAVSLSLRLEGYDEERGRQFYDRALEQVAAIRGVRAVSLATVLPVTSGGTRLQRPGNLFDPPLEGPVALEIVSAGPRFFETLGLPLVGGRDFRDSDGRDAPRVTVINESMARRFWPGRDPVGSTFFDGDTRHQVVGVARDTKYRDLRETPRLTMYIPLAQDYSARAELLVRGNTPARELQPAVRQSLAAIEPALAVFNVRTLREHVARSLAVERLQGLLLSILGALALVLSAVGLYGVMAYAVAQRTREIGVRMALGAERRHVLRLVLRQGLRLAVLGTGAGVLLSYWLTRALGSQLYGVRGGDPPTLAAAVAVLLGVTAVAALLPARRATRTDPLAALRYE